MYKKLLLLVISVTIFLYFSDFGYSKLNFGIIRAVKKKGDKLIDKVEKKREEIATSVPDEPIPNNSPSIPSNPTPANGATDQLVTVDLSWTGGDPDIGDTVTYDLYFGIASSPDIVSSGRITTNYDPGILSNRNTYYWRVVAKDNYGASAFGPVWTLRTSRWGCPQLIESDHIGGAQIPQVATDANGNAIVVYQTGHVLKSMMYNSIKYNIWSNRYVSGIGWETAQLIETDDTGAATCPQVAIDTSGNAIAVWHQSDGTRYNILSNRYEPGTGWGTAHLIETDDTGDAVCPKIAIDTSGNAIAVWYQYDGTRYNILSNRYEPGTGWGTAQLIETDDTGAAACPQVAIDTSGNAIAVWRQFDGTRSNIWSNRYEPSTGWETAQLIETDNAGSAQFPQVAIDTSGNAIVVWHQSDGIRYNIWSNRYEPGTGWETAQLIETDNAGSAQSPQVAIDTSGNAIVVWHQSDGIRLNIWSNRYEPGTGWETAQLIETDNAGSAQSPQVAIDTSGNAIAVWHQSSIWSNRYEPGTGWGTAQLIEPDNTGGAQSPQVAIDTSGNATAVWHQSDGMRYNIWSNRYENE